jgi:hypothetical protein
VRIDRIGVMNREAGAQSHHLLTPWALAQGENHIQCPSADKPTASQSPPSVFPGATTATACCGAGDHATTDGVAGRRGVTERQHGSRGGPRLTPCRPAPVAAPVRCPGLCRPPCGQHLVDVGRLLAGPPGEGPLWASGPRPVRAKWEQAHARIWAAVRGGCGLIRLNHEAGRGRARPARARPPHTLELQPQGRPQTSRSVNECRHAFGYDRCADALPSSVSPRPSLCGSAPRCAVAAQRSASCAGVTPTCPLSPRRNTSET